MADINFRITDSMLNTLVPNEFIDNYMPEAHPTYSCIYIYSLRHCAVSNNLSMSELANTFNLLESDVIRAWEYWEEKEIVKIHNDINNYEIEFLPIIPKKLAKASSDINDEILNNTEIIEKTSKIDEEEIDEIEDSKIVEIDETDTIEENIDEIIIKSPCEVSLSFPIEDFSNPPTYSTKELELYRDSFDVIKDLFEYAEKTLGKMLNARELSILYSFYDWLRLPIPVIKYLISYCSENGHRRINYLESVAIDWAESEIDTVEKAQSHVNLFNKDYRGILEALGQNQNPTPKQVEFIEKWINEYNLPMNIILEACDKTVIATDRNRIKYADTILESWHKKDVKTLDDVKELDRAFREKKESTPESKPKRKNRFANFSQRTRDTKELENMEKAILLKQIEDRENA